MGTVIPKDLKCKIALFFKSCQKSDSKFSWCKNGGNEKYYGCLGVQSLVLKIIYPEAVPDRY